MWTGGRCCPGQWDEQDQEGLEPEGVERGEQFITPQGRVRRIEMGQNQMRSSRVSARPVAKMTSGRRERLHGESAVATFEIGKPEGVPRVEELGRRSGGGPMTFKHEVSG